MRKPKLTPDLPIPRPTHLAGKIALIRATFKGQYDGWSKRESLEYLASIGIKVRSADELTNAQADEVLNDLGDAGMIIFDK